MQINQEKIEEATLALLFLTLHDENRAWKNFDFEIMDRLYEKGYINNPKNRAKSIVFTQNGLEKAEKCFEKLFKE